jgi:hypothetical protein
LGNIITVVLCIEYSLHRKDFCDARCPATGKEEKTAMANEQDEEGACHFEHKLQNGGIDPNWGLDDANLRVLHFAVVVFIQMSFFSREIDFRARKKVYNLVLRNYHNNMLETLQRWKEIWESCKDPET